MLVTTQWPLERAAHLTSLVWVCVIWRPESLTELSALCQFVWLVVPYNQTPFLEHYLAVSWCWCGTWRVYRDVIMSAMASQITSPTIVYSNVYSVADQRKHHSSASLAFVRGIHRWPVNSPHTGTVTWKMFSIDDVIMIVFRLWVYLFMLHAILSKLR